MPTARLWWCVTKSAIQELYTQMTLLWSSGAAPGGDVDLGFRPGGRGTSVARDQHTVDLPCNVALEAADDLSLALALLCAPRDVLLGATISAHPSQTDHVQRTVSVPVAAAVETMPDNLASGSFDGRDPAQTGEGSLATQTLGVVFKATISSVAAWSVPMAGKETHSRATCATNWSSFVRLARRSLSREPPNGEPPNGARTWSPCEPRRDHCRGGN